MDQIANLISIANTTWCGQTQLFGEYAHV